jgi:hypothetical protein
LKRREYEPPRRHPELLLEAGRDVPPQALGAATILFALGYVDDLADEDEIVSAGVVARADWPQWSAA